MNEQETAATVTGAETTAERLKEVTERFTALVEKLKASEELHDEERAVRLLAWKLEWDAMMRERNVAIGAHLAYAAANTAVTEQARLMIATRYEELKAMEVHRLAIERINERGYESIASAIKAMAAQLGDE